MTDERPLVLINDETLLDEVLRLAAAVGCEVERVPDTVAAESRWAGAPLVIVDEDVLTAAESPPRRDGVVLVCKSALPAGSWRVAFEAGVSKVVVLPDSENVLISAFADIAEGPRGGDGRVLAVLGGCGGAGASVFAAATGLAVCRDGADALLLDCDPLGGGADLVLGMERAEGLRWSGLRDTSGRLSMTDLAAALPARSHGGGSLSVLSCDRPGGGPTGPAGPTTEAVTAVLAAARRAGSTVICDVARHLGAGAAAAVANADLVIVVLPAEVRACAATAGVIRLLGRHTGRARIVVRGPGPDGLGGPAIARTLGVQLAAEFRSERALPRAIERGLFTGGPRSSLATAASEVLEALASACAEPVRS
ncbi:septum site-determining protein Ssd [Amycolatopsis marina]|uniref:septum site-determining protein Ssd n=1 Tax=Amycolatopsis marina TaxID=490629 RepID=UPI000AF83D1D|nr:septum site-determining protein Ssd [Amycolatopsis marina]